MNKEKLHDWYNATSTDDGKGGIEPYHDWLENQLISRVEKVEQLESEKKTLNSDLYHCRNNLKISEDQFKNKSSDFLAMYKLAERNGDIRMSPHLVSAKLAKGGGHITMGVEAKVIHDLAMLDDKYIATLYIINKRDFNELKVIS